MKPEIGGLQLPWRSGCVVVAWCLIGLSGPDPGAAQEWPSKTINAVVPFTPGSGADVMARIVMEQAAKQLGRAIVIENRGGAGGTLGNNVVAKAAPDGYTILVTGALSSAHALFPNRPYDTLQDLAPVSPLGQQPLVLVTAPEKGFRTLGDLIATARSKAGTLNFGSAGIGSASHFAAEHLRINAGFAAQHVPFRGAPEVSPRR